MFILPKYCIGSKQTVHNDKDHQLFFVRGPNVGQMNPRWRTVAVYKTINRYLGNGSADRYKI